jgi:GTP cyclohydrolase I
MEIEKYLLKKGLNPAFKGFDYIAEAVKLFNKDRKYKENLTKELYPTLAKIFNVSEQKVIRLMDYCIKSAGIKMTTSEFIATAQIETK